MTKITTDLTTHQEGLDMNGAQRMFADKAGRTAINEIDARQDMASSYARKTDFDLAVLKQAVSEGNLEKYGLKVGDQKTINGRTYVIADLNPMKGTTTPYRLTQNHVGLIVITWNVKQAWNASGLTTTGAHATYPTTQPTTAGYANSDLHYYLENTLLPLVEADLSVSGSSSLIGHSKMLTTQVNTTAVNRLASDSEKGASSGWAWEENCKICALSEVQIYGGTVWSSSGFDTGEACRQLEVFKKYSHTEIFANQYIWLRDVVSSSIAALAHVNGVANYITVSSASYVAALVLFH